MGIVEGGGEVKAICLWMCYFLGVGLNSFRLLLKEEVRLVVGFCGEGDDWFWGRGHW